MKLSWFQRRSNKINTMLHDRYYFQNCKAISFEKIADHTKYKKPNVQSHLHILWLNFDKANHSFLHTFLLLGEIDFSFCLGCDHMDLGASFEWWRAWVKTPQINAFSRDVNSIILKFFPHMGEYKSLRENLTSILETEIKP